MTNPATLSPALETLAWMERAVVGILREAGIEPHMADPASTRRAAQAADDPVRYAAFIFQHIQMLRMAREPDLAAELGLTIMFVYMDGREHFGWAAPRLSGSVEGGKSTKRKADAKWTKWEPMFSEVANFPKPAQELQARGCPYSLTAIRRRMKKCAKA